MIFPLMKNQVLRDLRLCGCIANFLLQLKPLGDITKHKRPSNNEIRMFSSLLCTSFERQGLSQLEHRFFVSESCKLRTPFKPHFLQSGIKAY